MFCRLVVNCLIFNSLFVIDFLNAFTLCLDSLYVDTFVRGMLHCYFKMHLQKQWKLQTNGVSRYTFMALLFLKTKTEIWDYLQCLITKPRPNVSYDKQIF